VSPLIEVGPPAAFTDESDETKPFETFRNYVGAFATIVRTDYGRLPYGILRERSAGLRGFGRLQRRDLEPADMKIISRDFRNAWATELALSIPRHAAANGLDDLMLAANHWTPTQVHYAAYRALRGALRALGCELKDTHADILELAENQLLRRDLLPRPWSCACGSGSPPEISPRSRLAFDWVDLPPGDELPNNLTYATPISMYPLAKKALKKTRDNWRLYEDRLRAWRIEEKKKRGKVVKNVPAAERQEIYSKLRQTTLFDLIYLIRRRVNYLDDDSFLAAGISANDAASFNEDLVLLARSTLHVLEAIVDASLGQAFLAKERDMFRSQVPSWLIKQTVLGRYP
jgi:hypothetical protein